MPLLAVHFATIASGLLGLLSTLGKDGVFVSRAVKRRLGELSSFAKELAVLHDTLVADFQKNIPTLLNAILGEKALQSAVQEQLDNQRKMSTLQSELLALDEKEALLLGKICELVVQLSGFDEMQGETKKDLDRLEVRVYTWSIRLLLV